MTQRVALPYFGMDPLPWRRPGLSIGGSGNNFTSWLNQVDGGDTATATDNANGLPLVLRAGFDLAQHCPTGLLKASPTPPWTITVALAGFSNAFSTTTINVCPLILQAAGGALVFIAWYGTFGSGPAFNVFSVANSSIGAAQTEIDDGNNAPI